jgi:hypothetical protein
MATRKFDWVAELQKLWVPGNHIVRTMSDEWKLARRGRLTASSRARSIAGPRAVGNFPKLKEKILAELSPKYEWVEQQFAATEWGNRYERDALDRMEEALGLSSGETCEPGFLLHPKRPYAGGTPDALIYRDKVKAAQVKCPHDEDIHERTLLTRKISDPVYVYQIQWEGWLVNADELLFVSFDPRQKRRERQLAMIDIPVDHGLRKIFDDRCDLFLAFMEGRVATSRPVGIDSLAASF